MARGSMTAWGVASAGAVGSGMTALLLHDVPVLAMITQMSVGAAGVAFGAYRGAAGKPPDLGIDHHARRHAIVWAAAFLLASAVWWAWAPLEERGLLPPARAQVENFVTRVERHADGSTSTWTHGSGGDAWWGPLPMVVCPVVFGLFGGAAAALVGRRRSLRALANALANGLIWAVAWVVSWRLAFMGSYLTGGLLGGLLGALWRPLTVIGLYLGCGLVGFALGCGAAAVVAPVIRFSAAATGTPTTAAVA